MKTPSIKFSHEYVKLFEANGYNMRAVPFDPVMRDKIGFIFKGRLMSVDIVELADLDEDFLLNDTVYLPRTRDWCGRNAAHIEELPRYPLPKRGKYLRLMFEGSDSNYSTLRRFTPNKTRYYTDQVGKDFGIIVERSPIV
jgi:hypothetical protein